MRMRTPESYEGHYTFAPESAPVCFEDGIAAAKVVPGYQLSNPWFEYHPEDGAVLPVSVWRSAYGR